jgi:PAS domain S-box-containing protein
VLSVNHFGAEQLGYQKEDLISQSVVQVFDLSDRRTVLERIMACVASPYTLLEWEAQKIRKDGTPLWVKERARAVHDHTGMMNYLANIYSKLNIGRRSQIAAFYAGSFKGSGRHLSMEAD